MKQHKNAVVFLILVCIAAVFTVGCASTQSAMVDPIVGSWIINSANPGTMTFAPDGQFAFTNDTTTTNAVWIKIRDNEYQVKSSVTGSVAFGISYTADGDYLITSVYPALHVYRLNAHGTAAPKVTPIVSAATPVVTPTPTIATSQDPIVGEWSLTFARGGSSQMYFGADGSVRDCIENSDQALATGVWRNIGGNQYTVSSTWVNGGKTSLDNWVLNTDSDTLYAVGSPTLVYSRVGGGYSNSAPSATTTPVMSKTTTFQGNGDDVQSFTATGDGIRIFSMSYSGDSNFIIWLEDAQGNKLDLLVNEIGSYNGKKSERMGPGTYYLDVSASGPWTITLTSA